jgi:hypothetical protein
MRIEISRIDLGARLVVTSDDEVLELSSFFDAKGRVTDQIGEAIVGFARSADATVVFHLRAFDRRRLQ